MGLRIHRALGYGLVLAKEDYENNYAPLLEKLADQFDVTDSSAVKKYVSYIKNKYESVDFRNLSIDYIYARSIDKMPKKITQVSISDIFHVVRPSSFDSFVPDGHVLFLVVPPFEQDDWYRVDNSIDYQDHMHKYGSPENTVTVLGKSIYPFNNHIMHKTTGELIPISPTQVVLNNLYENGSTNDDVLNEFSLRDYGLPYADVVENYTFVEVPVEVQDLLEWVGLTSREINISHKFTPVIADWWK